MWLDNIRLGLVSYIHIRRTMSELRGVVACGSAEILDLIILLCALIEIIIIIQVCWGELLMFPELLSLAQPRYGSLAAPAIPILISAGVCTDQVREIRDRWIIKPTLFPTSSAVPCCITHDYVANAGSRGVQERGSRPMMLRVEVYGDRGNRPSCLLEAVPYRALPLYCEWVM